MLCDLERDLGSTNISCVNIAHLNAHVITHFGVLNLHNGHSWHEVKLKVLNVLFPSPPNIIKRNSQLQPIRD